MSSYSVSLIFPYQSYVINGSSANVTSNDHPMIPCNQSFTEEGTGKNMSACLCDDCRDSPPTPTPTPKPDPFPELVITINSSNHFPMDSYLPYQQMKHVNFTGLLHKDILEEVLSLLRLDVVWTLK